MARPLPVVLAVLAAAVLAAGAFAFLVNASLGTVTREGCALPEFPAGDPLATRVVDSGPERNGSAWTRTITVTLADDASAVEGGAVLACTRVGDVHVRPSPDDSARIVFTVTGTEGWAGRGDAIVDGTDVNASLARAGDGLVVRAGLDSVGATDDWLLGGRSARVHVLVEVPAEGAFGLNGRTDVGEVTATSLPLADVNATTDVGNVVVRTPSLTGDAGLRADVGDVTLAADAVASGPVEVSADVGNVDVRLPDQPDAAFNVTASTDVGRVEIALGPDAPRAEQDGGRASVESPGFASAEVQRSVRARTDVGNVVVRVE